MEATRTATPCIDGMWNAYVLRVMHPAYRLILRWCDHIDFDDVLRIDHASIVAAATDPNRFIGSWRIVFGDGRLPKTVVPFGLVNTTHRYITERESESGRAAPPESPVFEEVNGVVVTRTSVCEAIRGAMILVRLGWAIRIDEAGHLV